jgi:hypothetical protein
MQERILAGELEDEAGVYRDWIEPVDWHAFLNGQDGEAAEWFMEPIWPSRAHIAIYAKSGTGKSLFLLDGAAARASGRSLFGGESREPLSIIYVDLENPADVVQDRMLDFGYKADDLDHLHYFHLPELPPLDTDLGGLVLAAQVERFQAVAVVIDTTSSSVGGPENDSDTYRDFYRYTGRRLRARGTALARVDHEGKDPRLGQRGSSAKDADMDVIFQMTASGNAITLKRTKCRFSWVPTSVQLRRHEEPVTRHELEPVVYPAGVAETALLLDKLNVALDTPVRVAMATLREAGEGRRQEVVSHALKYRRRPR